MCLSWYKPSIHGSYILKRMLNSSMNNCWSFLGLGKSLAIAFNSAHICSINSHAAHTPVSGRSRFLEATGLLGSWEKHGECQGSEQGEKEVGDDRAVEGEGRAMRRKREWCRPRRDGFRREMSLVCCLGLSHFQMNNFIQVKYCLWWPPKAQAILGEVTPVREMAMN